MTNPTLEEAVARAIADKIVFDGFDGLPETGGAITNKTEMILAAQSAIAAVLAHFEKPENVTEGMIDAFHDAFDDPKLPGGTTHVQAVRAGIAASMRAAAEGK
jgi:hypothetical protein